MTPIRFWVQRALVCAGLAVAATPAFALCADRTAPVTTTVKAPPAMSPAVILRSGLKVEDNEGIFWGAVTLSNRETVLPPLAAQSFVARETEATRTAGSSEGGWGIGVMALGMPLALAYLLLRKVNDACDYG